MTSKKPSEDRKTPTARRKAAPRKAPAKKRAPVSLVTGACGFMGTHMVEVLHAAGHEVRATDLASACKADDRDRGLFPSVLRSLGIEPRPADLTRPHTLAGLAKDVDYVFHIAGLFSYSAPWDALKAVNVGGTSALIDLVFEEAPGLRRFVMWGAGGVYGFKDNDGIPIREDDPPHPPNDYLLSKWRAEWTVMEAGRRRALPFAILRPTTVYGPRGVYGGGQMLMGPASMGMPMIPGNLTGRIPFVHVLDVCRAALFVAEEDRANGEVFNTNDDSTMSMVEYMRYVAALEGRAAFVLPGLIPVATMRSVAVGLGRALDAALRLVGKRSPLEPDSADYLGRDVLYSNDKLKSLGFSFTYPDARDGIRDTLRWYHDKGWI